MFRTISFAGLAPVALAACAAVSYSEIPRTETVDDGYSFLQLSLDGAATNYLAASAYENAGRVAVCAAIIEGDPGMMVGEATEHLRSASSFSIDGMLLASGATFAPVYPISGGLRGKTARCIRTAASWKPEYGDMRLGLSVKPGFIGS